MSSNRLAFMLLAVACIAAAAGGGYLATRQNTVPMPASAQSQPTTSPAATATTSQPAAAAKPVQETEAVVAPPASRPSAKPSVTRQAEPPVHSYAARESRAAASATMARQEQLPPPPSAAPAPQPPIAAPPIVDNPPPPMPRPDDRLAPQDPVRPAEPPPHQFEELVVSADSVLGLQTENRVSSDTAHVEDHIDARVTRDVRVAGRVAIPAGSRALGSVVLVERGGKVKERARLGVRFHTLVLADGTRIPISTDTIYRDGEAPGNSSSAKIGGGAVGGAILGAILGGGKGAAIGAAAGAGAGGAAVAASDRQNATLAAGSPLTVRILQPVTVTKDQN